MVHSDRFLELNTPMIDTDIIVYGGYRGIKVYKPELSIEMRLKVLEAIKQKIVWLYEKIGGEEEWLKQKSASILVAQNTSYWMTVGASRPLERNVSQSLGMIRSARTGSLSSEKLAKL